MQMFVGADNDQPTSASPPNNTEPMRIMMESSTVWQ